MVNLGKPSRGCQTCKDRRIKCDLTRPTCQRCIIGRYRCPGVPTEQDLVFRNQTQAGNRSKTRKKISSSSKSSITNTPTAVVKSASETPGERMSREYHDFIRERSPAPLRLNLSKETIAVAFYFRHFVPDPATSKWLTPYVEALRVLYPASFPSSPIHQMTTALAMASLSNYPSMDHFRPEADKKYTQALRLINTAIQDPVQSKTNDTLMSVMLMSIYESMSPSSRSLENIQNHMNGALALVRHRGPQVLRDPIALKIYRAIRSSYIFTCIQQSTSIEGSEEVSFWMSDSLDFYNPVNNLYIHSLGIPTLKARANDLFSSEGRAKHEDILDLIADSRKTDAQLTEWYSNLPKEWNYESVPYLAEMPDDIEEATAWPGTLHSYPDKFIASVYDTYSCFRIYVQEVISRCLANLDPDAQKPQSNMLLQATLFITRKLVDDICAGVPFQLSYPSASDKDAPTIMEQKASEAMGAFYLMRPLSVAASVECIPEQQRRWLRGRLRALATGYGFHQANRLSTGSAALTGGR